MNVVPVRGVISVDLYIISVPMVTNTVATIRGAGLKLFGRPVEDESRRSRHFIQALCA